MARFLISHVVVLVCVAGLALATVDTPCNDEHVYCDAGECCATLTGANEGYKGVCKPYLRSFQICTPGALEEGECPCGHSMICYPLSGTPPRCHYILP